ncbi:MAG: hypothetical protein VX874_06550 [Pseudomonadota bacterium]|nr:hypothetical protein [Pseudomonadota bacterium]
MTTFVSRDTISALALVCGLGLPTAASAETKLLFNCFWPSQHFMCQKVLAGWKADVERVTEGRVLIEMPAQSMAPPPEQLNSVRSGIFDGAIQANIFIANEITGPEVAFVPFASALDAEANSVALWRTYETYFADKGEYEGLQLLGLFATPGVDFYSLKDTPIDSLDAATSRKMWALPGTVADLMKSLDTPVVAGPAVQMTEIIQRGVVDGYVGIGAADSIALNTAPYVKSVTQTDRKINAGSFSFFVNERAWTSISEEDRALIMSVSGEAFARSAGNVWAEFERSAWEKLEGTLEIIPASEAFEAELAAVGQPYADAWIEEANAAGVDGEAALAYFRAQVDAFLDASN